uniref:Leucine-rich repeat and IQ domain-containing protein 4-like n=1 Tax=Crocodylus porosus TaxID=8502 RepID=A0A7M4F188_CROPO
MFVPRTCLPESTKSRAFKKSATAGREPGVFASADLRLGSPAGSGAEPRKKELSPVPVGADPPTNQPAEEPDPLYMDSNNLKEIPAEIGTLSRLERLTLSNNSLRSLPREIGHLQKLHSLHLANNSFTELPPQLCQLRNLAFLDLSDNQISSIPPGIQHLESLETLLLLFNLLEHLPGSICVLRNLCTLWLGNNKLRSLPANFGDLVNLDWGYNYCSCNFEGNPLECPPPEVCSRGPRQIREYFYWGQCPGPKHSTYNVSYRHPFGNGKKVGA